VDLSIVRDVHVQRERLRARIQPPVKILDAGPRPVRRHDARLRREEALDVGPAHASRGARHHGDAAFKLRMRGKYIYSHGFSSGWRDPAPRNTIGPMVDPARARAGIRG